MWWKLSGCGRYRALLALHVGADLGANDREAVERHFRVCPDCRDHWASLRRTRKVIEDSAQIRIAVPAGDSLWREVSNRLPSRSRSNSVFRKGPDGSIGWRDPRNIAVAGLSVAVTVMLSLVLQTFSPSRPHMAEDLAVVPADLGTVPVLGPSAFDPAPWNRLRSERTASPYRSDRYKAFQSESGTEDR